MKQQDINEIKETLKNIKKGISYSNGNPGGQLAFACIEITNAIAKLDQQQSDGWISVKDRLPEDIINFCNELYKNEFQNDNKTDYNYKDGACDFMCRIKDFIDSAPKSDKCKWKETDQNFCDGFKLISCKPYTEYDSTDVDIFKHCPNCGREIEREGE